MGSYNTSCAITGLPITGRKGEDITLVYYTVGTKHSTYESVTFIGRTFKGTYDDYGRFEVENNPLVTDLAPSAAYDSGILLLDNNEDTSETCANTLWVRGLDLWRASADALHYYHDVVDIPVKNALDVLKGEAYSVGLPESFNDYRGGAFAEDGPYSVKVKYPKAHARFIELMGDFPYDYSARSNLVYALMNGDREDGTTEEVDVIVKFIENGHFNKKGFVREVMARLKVPDSGTNFEQALKLANERLFIKLQLAAMHTCAYQEMVDCATNQLGKRLTQTLFDGLEDQLVAYKAQQESQRQELQGLQAASGKLARMLLRQLKNSIVRDTQTGYSLASSYSGNMPAELTQEQKDLMLFSLNFYHGFKFSSMVENRQYEGIAHIEAQARSTLKVLKAHKKDYHQAGHWDTYMYKKN